MLLIKSKGDMYNFVDYTANAISGKCSHICQYCYMNKYTDNRNELRLVKDQLQGSMFVRDTYLNKSITGKFIFIGSSTDMFAENISHEDIKLVLDYCDKFENEYLFQSKNPSRFLEFIKHPVFKKSILCTTIETNRNYKEFMGITPIVQERVQAMEEINKLGFRTMVTIEPIMDFDLDELLDLVKRCKPIQVNIGKNTYNKIKLPHPDKEKAKQLIRELKKFTKIEIKDNLIKKKN